MRPLAVFLAFTLLAPPLWATTVLLEAEQLELPGGWEQSVVARNDAVRKFLLAGPYAKGAPAAGGIEIPHAGKWKLWVRSKDYPQDRPGSRNFTVRLGEQRAAKLFGKHGREEMEGWAWEDGGVLELAAGPTLVAIGDEVTSSARCDAILLTDNLGYQPDGPPWKLNKEMAKLAPLTIDEKSLSSFLPPAVQSAEETPVATLQNDTVRFTFHPAQTASGPAITLHAATKEGDQWQPLNDEAAGESYRILFRPKESDPKINPHKVHPTWDLSFSPFLEAKVGGVSVRSRLGIATAPWASAKCLALRPIAATQRDANTVDLTFADTTAGQLTATWQLIAKQPSASLALHFTPKAPGHFSLGYHGPLTSEPEATDFMLLPFMFHGHRFPEQPVTLLSALTPTPLTLINKGGLSCAVVGEPGDLSAGWPSSTNSRFALALRNEAGLAQPMIYSPVLGQPGSTSEGAPVDAHFRLWLQRGDWYAGYQQIAQEVFHLTDYRRPTTASLSDTALNLMDLMRNEEAAGWNAKAKGPWNIESRNTVSQSSPLTYLSLYLLTGDDDFYRRFALPSMEYLLSRPGPHFAAEREIWDNYYHHQPMKGPGSYFGASTFASAFAMTQGRSPVFGELCLDDQGAARLTRGGGHTQTFADLLAIYRVTGEQRWLDEAVAAADKYIAANLTKLPSKDLGPNPFINVSFVPDWEGLLHLYEATGEKRFLDASREGARWLTTTLWTQPLIPAGDQTIHPGGLYDANRHIWWFGDHLFRRAVYQGAADVEPPYPAPTPLPGKQVPAWQVSQVGLGLEQPSTYNRKGPQANIMMNVWAANLLRLSSAAGEDTFRTAARNGTIGRFANYPGYYLDGFTDREQAADYPIKGPDVTSLYVHHIPPFTAWVVDYLFTDAETRSKGAVKFPSTRQCGYVWFDSRLYGQAPGKVYGHTAWPWLHRTAAKADTVNVDVVLAHGDRKFHAVLLNQVKEPQRVRVCFDEKVLGRSVEGAALTVRMDNQPAPDLIIKNGVAELTLKPLGIAALMLEDVKIDVATHRFTPPDRMPLPTAPARLRLPFAETKLEAVGSVLQVPPFEWRDLYVYVTASIDDCKTARLRYRVGDGPEQRVEKHEFPWEFSVRVTDLKAPITWQMEVETTDGRSITAKP
jgi:hypothetical protein